VECHIATPIGFDRLNPAKGKLVGGSNDVSRQTRSASEGDDRGMLDEQKLLLRAGDDVRMDALLKRPCIAVWKNAKIPNQHAR
jgi:hypothetical protein